MATTYQWHPAGARLAGCPGTAMSAGWYEVGSTTPIVSTYLNPATGAAYTPAELAEGGGTTPTGTPTTPAPPGYGESGLYTSPFNQWLAETYPDVFEAGNLTPEQQAQYAAEFTAAANVGGWSTENNQLVRPTTPGAGVPAVPMPTFDPSAISAPSVTPAPAYEPSPAQTAFEETVGGIVTDWVEAGGYGIPEETQALMIQKQTDSLKARETENIRVMRNNMERRGITNSGFVYANEQKIRSNTSVAIANAISDIQIKSALMKMASFEKAIGAAAQFLGYLSEQSQLANNPKYMTWQAQQMAKMQAWQASFDKYKMELNQAYQTQNMTYAAQIAAEVAEQENIWDVEMAEMEIEAANQQAAAQGIGSLFGITAGFFMA